MIQGVQVEDQYIGYVEALPNGKYRAWSEPVAMAAIFPRYMMAVEWLGETAKACGIDGTLRTPERRMQLDKHYDQLNRTDKDTHLWSPHKREA